MGLIKDSVSTFATQIFMQVVRFGSGVIIARLLMPEGKGYYVLLILVPQSVIALGNFGIAVSTVHFTSKGDLPAGRIATNALALAAILGTFYGISIYMLADHGFLYFLKGIRQEHFLLAAVATPFAMMARCQQGILLGRKMIFERNISFLVEVTVTAAGIVVAVLILGLGLQAALLSWMSGVILGAVAGFVFVRPILSLKEVPDFGILKKLLGFGIKAHIGALALFLLINSDKFLINYFLPDGQTQVGLYAVATSLILIVIYIPDSIATMFLPRVTSLETVDADAYTSSVSRITVLIALAAISGAALAAWPVVHFMYGRNYYDSMLPFFLLLPGVFFISVSAIMNNALQARKMVFPGAFASLAGCTVNICLNLLVIPRWGIRGAAVTSTISYTIVAAFIVCRYLSVSKAGFRETILPGRAEFVLVTEFFRRKLVPRIRMITGL